MAKTTKFATIRFDKDVQEKLEDSFDYQDAVTNIRESNGRTVSRGNVKKQLGL